MGVSTNDAIVHVRAWAREARHGVEFLPTTWDRGQRAAAQLGLSTRSTLGAVVHHTGGMLIDEGWLRVYGAGHVRLPRAAHKFSARVGFDAGVVVADDALGGFFSLHEPSNAVHYLSPDHRGWESLDLDYADWLGAMLGDGFAGFYANLRWTGWRDEIRRLNAEQGVEVRPPLWESGPPLSQRDRRARSMTELWERPRTRASAT